MEGNERKIRELFNSFGFARPMFEALNRKIGVKTGYGPVPPDEWAFSVVKTLAKEAEGRIYQPYRALLEYRKKLLAQMPSKERDERLETVRQRSSQYEAAFGMSADRFLVRFEELRGLLAA